MNFVQTYAGMVLGVVVIVLVGGLATQGLLEEKYADLATGLITGGGVGLLAGAKITPKDKTGVSS